MNKSKIFNHWKSVLVFFLTIALMSESLDASDLVVSDLCIFNYDQKQEAYYCRDKIRKVYFSVNMDGFYFNREFDYLNYLRAYVSDSLVRISGSIDPYSFKIVDQSLITKNLTKKKEVFFQWTFLPPNDSESSVKVVYFVSKDGKATTSISTFLIDNDKDLKDELKDIFRRVTQRTLSSIYSKEGFYK